MKNKIRSLFLIVALLIVVCLSFSSCDALISDYIGDDSFISDILGVDDGNENDDLDDGENETQDADQSGNQNANPDGTQSGNQNTNPDGTQSGNQNDNPFENGFDYSKIPAYSGKAYYVVNNNKPFFTEEEIVTESYEKYNALDSLGRCTYAMACIGRDLMPTEPREDIGHIKPTGWMQADYSFVSGGKLYNRCHMIAFQLTGENANRENLVTGTRYMNEAMIPFENQIADYIKEEVTNHVMYRVTVIFKGNNLLCEGVLLEAYSVEDDGEEISLNVFLYNVQPGVVIDYATGASEAEDKEHEDNVVGECKYVLNTNSKKIHKPTCGNVKTISEKNRKETDKSIEELLEEGYTKGGCCNPS